MSTNYSVTFYNDTNEPKVVHFCIYQSYPELPGLKTVAWKEAGVYRGGKSEVTWKIAYNAMICEYHDDGGRYTNSQSCNANLKDEFEVTDKDGTQVLDYFDSKGSEGTISICNSSNEKAKVGIGVDKSLAIVVPDVDGNIKTVFKITPTYYVAAYEDLKKGQVISEVGLIDHPLELKFTPGKTKAEAHLEQVGNSLKLSLKTND
ncbi:39277_t:CDS:2 [Gigaspora margarita]|uniref:39277_t:CDS:1 n=1 Tax=Gigaspora margarita TaxID=4874 RepID=A0ABN7UKY8_GIGMA|nr:39277_t:CDS:2 [Gigaspora margarita]